MKIRNVILAAVLCLAPMTPAHAYENEGRYVLRIMKGRAVINNRIPAVVLDSYAGIVWTCQNLQDGKPLWVRADLGKLGDNFPQEKRYTVEMLEWQDADLRMPAIMLDTKTGVVWSCQNIVDGKALWVQVNLNTGEMSEVARTELGVIKE